MGGYASSQLRSILDRRAQQQKAAGIQKFMSSPEYQDMPLAQKASLTATLFGPEVGRTVLQAEQMQQRGLLPEDPEELSGLLRRFGMSEERARNMADLYSKLTTGGKTKFADIIFENIRRGTLGQEITPEQIRDIEPTRPIVEPTAKMADISSQEVKRFDFPKFDNFAGMTPAESIKLKSELRKENAPIYKENVNKLKGHQHEYRSIIQLERLNATGKLPTGIQRWNVDWKSGELRIPALATPETQLFVKTINDFTVKAKDTFGARVTNFELKRFMQRLPTLANTTEGRRLIIEQMKTISELNQIYNDSLKEVYRKYGASNIDSIQVEQVAEDLRKDKEQALINKYASIVAEQDLQTEEDQVLIEFQGKRGHVSRTELDAAIKAGARVL